MKRTHVFLPAVYRCRMTLSIGIIFLAAFILLFTVELTADSPSVQKYLMRFPDVHGDTIVFVYGEDIWKVPAAGGVAVRLTIHDGEERFPKFSPDGKTIAFSGEYDGNVDVYVMNVHGGNINRVTYHPGDDVVVGWHPVENKIIFSSERRGFGRVGRLFLVSPDGTGMKGLILHEAAAGSFSSNGKKIAYNRVARENRTWKRYRGGRAQEIYLYDFEKKEDSNLTNFIGTDRIPMWIGDTIYFSSDRDSVLNIYGFDTKTGKIEQITRHREFDVRRPSKGKNKIVYELGGQLRLLDVTTKQTRTVPVEIRTDAPERRPYIKKVDQFITGYDCSPGGERALIVARGEVFTVPKKNGPTRNLTRDPGARDKDAAWSPDGKTIAYISDKSGEYEIYLVDPGGSKEAVRLTQHKDGYRHTLRWSPDSKKIAFADQTLRCYYLDIKTKKITEVDKAFYEHVDIALDLKPIYDFTWSPDSRFLAYSKMDADLVNQLYIFSLETGKTHCASNGMFNDFGPVFSTDGRHLFFISNRRFSPTFCDFEWEMVYKKIAGIYCITLQKNGRPLLPPESDEGGKKNKKDKDKDGKEKNIHVVVDFEGISGRIEALPLPRGNYRCLAVNDTSLFYLDADEGDFNRFEFREQPLKNLKAFSFKDREERTVIKDIEGFKLSADKTHILYKTENAVGIIKPGKKTGDEKSAKETLDLSDLKMYYEPLKEWQQIFNEVWRIERDFYYDANMKGIDWTAMKKKYGPLIPLATCRQDTRFIVGELISELSTSHTYVYDGDRLRRAKEVDIGMLGVDWQEDTKNKRFRFKKIYRIPDWSREEVPPLAGPGIHVSEGDYLLAVNGKEATTANNIYSYFQDLAGKQVTIRVNSKPTEVGAREFTVKPISQESGLRYRDWVEHNRLLAQKESKGQIGYIHLPDTFERSAIEFPKYFYSQIRKKGIIVDGRFNRGGLDPNIFLGRLDKKVHSYWTRRYSHHQTSPVMAPRAHFVCLINRHAGSGGDELPAVFRARKMGPIIGTRTWGGLVGVSMTVELIDGGNITAPDYRIYSPKGEWIIENIGVEPDITVDLHPVEMDRGHDAQLMRGIQELMKKIKQDPKPWPKHKPYIVE